MYVVEKYGAEVLNTPSLNKGSAFSNKEREKLRLKGLLPAAVESMDLQLKRELRNLRSKPNNLEKYVYLAELLNRNQTLFYRLLVENIKECMPIVYTPTVGSACIDFSAIWSQPRGIYVSIKDKGNVISILQRWKMHQPVVKAIVFTDGERILGLGDLGVNGMGIPIGKLQLYSACAGVNPDHCLPVCIDNGTNNQNLIDDELYLGLKKPRTRGKVFNELILEFMEGCQKIFGRNVLMQFEDFGNSTAFGLLEMTKNRFTTFNDDIQGTACVAVAGILASLKAPKTFNTLAEHKVLFLGAGEAGTGIGELLAYSIAKETGKTLSEARKRIFFVDSKGLVTKARKKSEKLAHHKIPFAHKTNDCKTLLEAVKLIRPTVIIGVSAQPKTFTKEVITTMQSQCKEKGVNPIIFALSNPTVKCECTAQEAYDWTNGNCIFASGSPFGVVSSNGKTFEPGQGNNAYIFPGLALGVIAAEASSIPEDLFYLTAKGLSEMVQEEDIQRGSMYPKLEDIRAVSEKLAIKVAHACVEMGIAGVPKNSDVEKLVKEEMVSFDYEKYN
eukprot:snap_masked-scaffold_14-processed-gene-6.19-mRNA-1 protein AED:0.01 eAED:0.01 QI:0/-1/0/1/-1/1/1/0/556